MERNSTLSPFLSIEKQVLFLADLAEQVINLIQDNDYPAPPETLESLETLIETSNRLGQKIREREEERKELLALSGIGNVINSSLNLDEVLRIVMDSIVRLTGAERGFLMLSDNTGEMSIRVARNWEQESLEESEFALSRSVIRRVVDGREPVLTTNAVQDPRFGGQKSIIAHKLRSILCVPILLKGDLIGVIYLDNRIRSGLFTKTDCSLLSTIADQAAVAIDNARLYESVNQTLDEVTHLKNFMDDIFTSVASGVITIDSKDTITLSNRAAETILGRDGSNLVGLKITSILPQIAPELNRHIHQIRQTGQQVVGLEYSLVLPGRDRVSLLFSLSPLKGTGKESEGITIVLDDLTEKKNLEAHRRLFERMVSPAVIQQLNIDNLPLAGKRTEITTLFADLRAFTNFSERHDPEELVSILNHYLAAAAEAVLSQEGTVDKFLGDALMAFFNAPVPQANHTMRAVKAAFAIQEKALALQRQLPPAFSLSFGIGIHDGEAVLGIIGTEQRMEYTAIGDSVNTAKRIQQHAAGGQILISYQAYCKVADQVEARLINPIKAKGKRDPIQVYELLGMK